MTENLRLLRAEMARRGLDAVIVPHADEYQNEYLPACNERLAWVSGFTGSAGQAVITATHAALFVDGRYTIQAVEQSPGFEQRHHIDDTVEAWLADMLPDGGTVGYDPWLHTCREADQLRSALENRGFRTSAQATNPIDAVWHDRPHRPAASIASHDLRFAGISSAEKRDALALDVKVLDADAVILTDPASLAWLLNMRGGDVPCTPVPLSTGILHADGSLDWYVDRRKLNGLAEVGVRLCSEADFVPALAAFPGRRVVVDEAGSPAAIAELLRQSGALVVNAPNPCLLPRAQKNAVEQVGARTAHARDAVAVVRFLAWLSRQDVGHLTELDIVAKLESCRAISPSYRGHSFETIAGSGGNGAIVHYRVTNASNRKLENGSFLLVDSGGQYPEGTTDITRTIALGEVTDEMRDRFTRVLRGHIALAGVRFPAGTNGRQLDTLARQFLWPLHLNYDHGTGHGVGSYLSVHEGPQRISAKAEQVPLLVGMIVSNEPGYYKAGEYGIRHENLMMVQSDHETWNHFETLSLVPFQLSALDRSQMSKGEIDWLNAYHARVREAVAPQLDDLDTAWLVEATKPI